MPYDSCTLFAKKHHPSYFLHLTSSWFSQLLYDSFYLTGRKRLAGGFVAHLLQLLTKLGAASNPTHQVAHGCVWAAVWEVHQRQFLLGVRSYSKIIHIIIVRLYIQHSSTPPKGEPEGAFK